MMENSLAQNASSDGFQSHNQGHGVAEWCLSEKSRPFRIGSGGNWSFHFWSSPEAFFLASPMADSLGGRDDSRGNWRSNRSQQLGSTPMERAETESSTPQSSVMSSVVVVDNNKKAGGPGETSKTKYLKQLSAIFGTLWKLLRKSGGANSQASLNEEITEQLRMSSAKDENLGNLNVIHKLILPHREEPKEVTSNWDESVKKLEPGSSLDQASAAGELSCDGRSCVNRIQSFQMKDLFTRFVVSTEKEKSEVQKKAECYASSTVNLATALGFFSRMCSLESLEMLVHAASGHGDRRGTLALSLADGPKANKGMENWSWGTDGVSCERGLQSTKACNFSGLISQG